MRIVDDLLPYHQNLERREPEHFDLVVIHCTELPDLKTAREFGERIVYPESRTGNSGHYYIDRDGVIYRFVQDDRIARHVIGHNANSIGIELVNSGRYPHWYRSGNQIPQEPYPAEQVAALKELLRFLKQKYPGILRIACHSDLDTQEIPAEDSPSTRIRRKIDPGPLFPRDEIFTFWKSL